MKGSEKFGEKIIMTAHQGMIEVVTRNKADFYSIKFREQLVDHPF